MKPIKRQRVHELVIQEIQKSLASGELKPGDRLPPERELSANLKVSRPSLREALRVLEFMGIVERRPGGGTFTRGAGIATLMTSFTTILAEQRPFMFQMLELRHILEPSIARLAAQRARSRDIAKLRTILKRHERKVRQNEPALEEDAAFHRAVAEATQNHVIVKNVDSLHGALQEWRAIWVQGRPAHSIEGHERLFHAIERKDATAAERAM
ncbi:MAG: FadR/GntR family transcriptional regulator, partial [Armatimonadota bacterium]